MDIKINLDRDFEMTYDTLQKEYGSDMARLNGFDDPQLSYTDFIDNFVDKQTVADASIDGNANVGHKDIVSLENEMSKPHSKLLAFNKIFYELKKKYGYATAVEWLRNEWDGHFYLHDAYNTTYKPYCLRGDTEFITADGVKTLSEMCGNDVTVLNKNHGWEHGVVKCFGEDTIWEITLSYYGSTKTVYATGNHKWFVYDSDMMGKSICPTCELRSNDRIPKNNTKDWATVNPSSIGVAHGFFIGDGYKSGNRANFCGDKIALIPYFSPCNVSGDEKEYNVCGIPNFFCDLPSISETKSYLLGWLSGFFAADGCIGKDGTCVLTSCNYGYIKFARDVCAKLGMPVWDIRTQLRTSNLTNQAGEVYYLTLSKECLRDDFFIRPSHKENFRKWTSNYADGRNHRDYWRVVSVKKTNMVEPVYCVETDSTGSFTLTGGVLTHNCFAYDIEPLVQKGLCFIDNFNAKPPQHLTTFTDFVAEFVSWTCNRSSGAVGLPSFLIYSFYFWMKDCKDGYFISSPEYYRDQSFQEIIYRLNQPYLRSGIQSAFTNFSIFDRSYLEALFGGKEYPDGTFIIDYIDGILEYQKAFMDVVSEVRVQNMMTFPVLTYALLRKDGKFVDEDFAKWCCSHNMKWGDSNFFVSDDVTSLSNCCFMGNQQTLTKSSNGVNLMSFKDLYSSPYKQYKQNFTVLHNGNWVKGKVIRVPARQFYKVTTSNKKEIIVTDDHINPTLRGDVRTCELTTDDYIMFNTKPLNAPHETDEKLSYEQGYLIGMYLGDGSMQDENNTNLTTTVHLSLNEEKYKSAVNIVAKAIGEDKIKLGKTYNNVYPVSIRDNAIAEFIRRFVHGKYSFEKTLNMDCILQSIEFRRGILDGYYATDGGNSNRMYTTSSKLVEDIECLCTSLGMNTVIDVSDRAGENNVVIRGSAYNRNYPVYCIRWYETYRRSQNNQYKWRNNSLYFKIESIEKIKSNEQYSYCFEMENEEEPYFTLPNGVITHNCRLKSDIKNLGYFNSVGGTALEVGSIKVNTINLARLAYECDTTEEYLEKLKEETNLCLKVLDRVRHIILRNVDKGLLPNYSEQIINAEKQYNTIGIIGLYEALQKYGFVDRDQLGNVVYTDGGIEFARDIMDVLNETKDEFTKDLKYMANIEQIPGERAASILMQKDKMIFPGEAYELPLYGNQWIPLGVKTTLYEKIRISAILDNACNGGSIAHINLDAPLTDFDTAWKLLNYVADEGVQYFAFNLRISACKHNHGFYGNTCPICGEPVATTYQRIVGFLVPTNTYSKERKEEFAMRDWFVIGDDLL